MEETLEEFKRFSLSTPYKEGVWDCATMVAFWAQALEGRFYTLEIGEYSTKLEGMRWMESVCPGARTVAEITDFLLTDDRWERVEGEALELKAGDLVEIEHGGVCIWDGKSALGLATGKTGYCVLSRTHVRAYWRFQPEGEE